MSRNANKRPCSHAGCRAWAIRGGNLCSAHAGRTRLPSHQPPEVAAAPHPPPGELYLPTLEEEIALLAARRSEVDRRLRQRMEEDGWEIAGALRYLTVLAQVGRCLGAMLAQREAMGGAAELERFFEAVAERVREIEGPALPQAPPDRQPD